MRAWTWMLIAGLAACAGPPSAPSADDEPAAGTVASADGVAIAWTSTGEGSPTLVFVHGWSCDQATWREQVGVFGKNHRVVTLDLGGHGASGTDRTEWTLESLADDVIAVARTLDLDDVVLVGHSMGAPVSLLAAARMPERAVGVVAVDALHDVEAEIPLELWANLIAEYRADWAGTCDGFVRSMFPEGAAAELVESTTDDICASEPEIAVALLERFPDLDAKAALSAAGVPVRAINAAGHPTAVESNRAYADFDATVMEDVGHFLFLERPGEFNQLLAAELADLSSPAG